MIPVNQWSPETGGFFLIDKPKGWTSFDVVNKMRYRLRIVSKDKKIKVGHTGTLDPLATGLLIVCVGKMTKQIDGFMGLPKTYTGEITFGASTPSYDAETEPDAILPYNHITPEILERARLSFLGNIEQMPPMYSAIKVAGKPLYESARQGKTIEVPARPVFIESFTLVIGHWTLVVDKTGNSTSSFQCPMTLNFEVNCSKGTYIRSLVHDFGKACGTVAFMSALRRTAIGTYSINEALTIEKWEERFEI